MKQARANELAKQITANTGWFAMPQMERASDPENGWSVGASLWRDGEQVFVSINDLVLEACGLLKIAGALDDIEHPTGDAWLALQKEQGKAAPGLSNMPKLKSN